MQVVCIKKLNNDAIFTLYLISDSTCIFCWGMDCYRHYKYMYIQEPHLIDASIKEWPQTQLVPSEEICTHVLCIKMY